MTAQTGTRRRTTIALAAVALALSAGCNQNDDTSGTTTTTPGSGTATSVAPSPAQQITAACPLISVQTVASTFNVQQPKATEKAPIKTGPATTYACDFSDATDLFLTVGVAVAPASGTIDANILAALSGKVGEPVNGVGEGGAYAETGGVGTVAGIKKTGSEYRLVFAHGAAGSKDQLIAVAREVATKV